MVLLTSVPFRYALCKTKTLKTILAVFGRTCSHCVHHLVRNLNLWFRPSAQVQVRLFYGAFDTKGHLCRSSKRCSYSGQCKSKLFYIIITSNLSSFFYRLAAVLRYFKTSNFWVSVVKLTWSTAVIKSCAKSARNDFPVAVNRKFCSICHRLAII